MRIFQGIVFIWTRTCSRINAVTTASRWLWRRGMYGAEPPAVYQSQPIDCQAHYLALISFLLINMTWQLMMLLIFPCILIVTIKLYIANSILRLSISIGTFSLGLPMLKSKCNSQNTWISSLGFFYFLTKMSMNKSVVLTELWWMLF